MNRSEIIHYARLDLIAPGARHNTLVMFGNVALVCALTLASYGLTFGSSRVQKERLKADAWALCLWAGDSFLTKNRVTPNDVRQLEREIQSDLPDWNPQEKCFPFRIIDDLQFGLPSQQTNVPLRGRTLLVSAARRDPMLDGVQLRHGRAPTEPDEEGVFLSPQALTRLGVKDTDTTPTKLTVYVPDRAVLTLNVLGVSRVDLPNSLDFVLSEFTDQRIRTKHPEPRSHVESGPWPEKWPPPTAWPDRLRDRLAQHWQIKLPSPTFNQGADRLLLEVLADGDQTGYSDEKWGQILAEIADTMKQATKVESTEFTQVVPAPPQPEAAAPSDAPANSDMVGLYFESVDDLKPAADACDRVRRLTKTVNRDVINQLARIGEETRALLGVVTMFQVVVLLLAICNMGVLQWMQASLKTPEAGMLRAMGMSSSTMARISLAEALLVSVPACLAGVILGLASAFSLSCAWYGNLRETWLGVQIPWWIWLAVIIGSQCVYVGCSWVSTRRWQTKSPGRLLGTE